MPADGRATRFATAVSAALVVTAIAATALVALDARSDLRAVVVVGFLTVCPGLAAVRLTPLRDPLEQAVYAVALSVSIGVLAALAMLFSGHWEPAACVVALAAWVILASVARLARDRRAARPAGAAVGLEGTP
jgi:uncharacterized membrane protein